MIIKKYESRQLHLKEKTSLHSNVGGESVKFMRHRFYIENSAVLAKKRIARRMICRCGKPKAIRYSECWHCKEARKVI